jgi:hypothetical protein
MATCHCVAAVLDTDGDAQAPVESPTERAARIHDRVSSNVLGTYTEVLPDQHVTPTAISTDFSDISTARIQFSYRFDATEDKTAMLDTIESSVLDDAVWYQIRYHACEHDIQTGVGLADCPSPTLERESGSVPTDVKTNIS